MPGRHPCERGERCSCHRAGPSTPPRKKTAILAAAALVCPVLAAPTPTHLPFLYPSLDKRVTDAGQAPDDPSEGFTHQHIQLADLIRAGLPYKYVYDPSANVKQLEEELELKEEGGAWVIDNAWSLHGRRFGPLYATATAGITDDPLPTPTESIPPASTPTTTTTSPPTMLAIQSSLPTGWDSTQYERSDMYAIPLVVSFALVIALMIGSLIGALVIRRSKSRSRRRKKRIIQGDDDSAREKVAQSSLVSRVGRALRHRDQLDEPEEDPRTELEHRVKSWARRSAAWRVQARVGVRRRMGRGRKRSQADNQPGSISGAIQEEPEAEEREATRAPTPVQSRAPTPTPIATNTEPPSAAPNYSSPVVPTYSSSPDAGPSTPITRPEPRADPMTRMEAHPDATPSDEPAYDDPGAGQGLPPAYRGGGLSEVARGKRPAHTESTPDPAPEPEQRPEEPRVWTELDAYAFGQEGMGEAVTAHVATDDKRVLERLHLMRGAPEGLEAEEEVHAPREEDVFGSVTPGGSDPSSSAGAGEVLLPSSEAQVASPLPETSGGVLPSSGTGVLPLPPTKTGTGPVARYGEADLSLPRYLDGQEGISGPGMGMPSAPELETGVGLGVPSAPGGMEGLEGLVPSAPPCEEEMVLPSAPVLEDEMPGPSAPLMDEDSVAFAPPMDGDSVASAPSLGDDSVASAPPLDDHPMTSSLNSVPSAPPLDDHSSASTSPSTPLHDDDDALHPDDKTALRPPTPQLRRLNSSSPLLSEER